MIDVAPIRTIMDGVEWVLLGTTLLVAVGAGPGPYDPRISLSAHEIQRSIGGLGLGSSRTATWGFHAFDERLESHCEAEDWPRPGGPCYSPDHSTAARGLERGGSPRHAARVDEP